MPTIAAYTFGALSGLSFIAGVLLLRAASREEEFGHDRLARGLRWFAGSAFAFSLYFAATLFL